MTPTSPTHDDERSTARLSLRRFTAADGPALHGYLGRPDAVEFEPYGPASAQQSARAAAERATDPRFWAVDLRGTGALVGHVYLARVEPDWWGTWELGYVFHPDHWGHGYAIEACTALLDQVFADGAHRVVASCNPANPRSWSLLERLGLRREGHVLDAVAFTKDAEGRPDWHDAFHYAVLADEWRRGRAGSVR